MRSRVLDEVGIDQGNNISAQRLIPFRACRVEDLEPSLEIRVTNERVVMSEIATIGLDIAKNVFVRPESRVSFCFTGGNIA